MHFDTSSSNNDNIFIQRHFQENTVVRKFSKNAISFVLCPLVLATFCDAQVASGVKTPVAQPAHKSKPIYLRKLRCEFVESGEINYYYTKKLDSIIERTFKHYGYTLIDSATFFSQDVDSTQKFVVSGYCQSFSEKRSTSFYKRHGIVIQWTISDADGAFFKVFDSYGILTNTEKSFENLLLEVRFATTNLLARNPIYHLFRLDWENTNIKMLEKKRPKQLFVSLCDSDAKLTLPDDLQHALNSVVTIKVKSYWSSGHGTGFFISHHGHILTAAHVVAGANEIYVYDVLGKRFEASILILDNSADVALIKITDSSHSCIPLKLDILPPPGTDAYAIGTPILEALKFTVTKGVVSAVRSFGNIILVQTDAAVNPGNSGGPLLDSFGNAIGIISWKLKANVSEGLGFAVSIINAIRVLHIYPIEAD